MLYELLLKDNLWTNISDKNIIYFLKRRQFDQCTNAITTMIRIRVIYILDKKAAPHYKIVSYTFVTFLRIDYVFRKCIVKNAQ